jgi:hypothetical protein
LVAVKEGDVMAKMLVQCMHCNEVVDAEETAMRAASHPHKDDPSRECTGSRMPGVFGTQRPA